MQKVHDKFVRVERDGRFNSRLHKLADRVVPADFATFFIASLVFFLCFSTAHAQNPCAEPRARALVLGGGGSKGGFEAGAAYHLIVHRGCDFAEISGISAGALNGAILAQAETSAESERSLSALEEQAEKLVRLWSSFKSSKDILKARRFAMFRWGLFGLESMKDFTPLRRLIQTNVSLERLEMGRPFRVGTLSFADGRYHEIVINAEETVDGDTAHDFIFGSAIVPVFGMMPRIARKEGHQRGELLQYGDGSLRHSTPVMSYFKVCQTEIRAQDNASNNRCMPIGAEDAPRHPAVEQLFVIVTTPYERETDLQPIVNRTAFKQGTQQITDGRRVMSRMFDLLGNSIYRDDLDDAFLANDMLRWRADVTATGIKSQRSFPLESYNVDPAHPEAVSKPYQIVLINPSRQDTDSANMFDFRPENISRQLYCGCVAADLAMEREFGLESMAERCAEKFSPVRLGGAVSWRMLACGAADPSEQVVAGEPRRFSSSTEGDPGPDARPVQKSLAP